MRESQRYSKKLIIIITVVIICGIVSTLWMMFGKDSISFSEHDAREQIAKHIPTTKIDTIVGMEYSITIDQVSVDFVEGDRIGIEASGIVDSSKGGVNFSVVTVGVPDLRNNAFYFRPNSFEFTEFVFSKKAQKSSRVLGIVAANTIKKYTGDLFKGTDIKIDKKAITEKIQAKIKIMTHSAIVGYLNKNPIKKLETGKEKIIGAAIKKISVDGDNITIHFSFWNLAKYVLVFILAFIAAIGLLVSAPWWAADLAFLAAILS